MNGILIVTVLFLLIVEIIFLVFYLRHRNKDKNDVNDWITTHRDQHKMTHGDYQRILLKLHKDMKQNKNMSEQNSSKIGVLQDVATDNRLMINVNEEDIQKQKDVALKNHADNLKRIDNTNMMITEHEEAIRNNLERIKMNDLLITNNEDDMNTRFDQISARTAAAVYKNRRRIDHNNEAINALSNELKQVKTNLANGTYSPNVEDITHRTMTLLDLAEFKDLDVSVKNLYKKTIVDQFMPHLIMYLNKLLSDMEIVLFLQQHTTDLANIFEKGIKIFKLMIDEQYDETYNMLQLGLQEFMNNQLSLIANNPDYMLGVFIPTMLDRFYKETLGLKNYPDKTLLISPDVIVVPDSNNNHVAKILGEKVDLSRTYNFTTNAVEVNKLGKSELEDAFDKETRDGLLILYMYTLYRIVEMIGGFRNSP